MDQASQERLAAIIATGPDSITAADAEFLRARRNYLNEEQKAVFATVFSTDAPVSNPASEAMAPDQETEKPAKKK